jgi:hypothetical protein
MPHLSTFEKIRMMNPVSRIHPALLRKDNYFKTLPEGKLVKILALVKSAGGWGRNSPPPPNKIENKRKIEIEKLKILNALNLNRNIVS